MTLFECTGGAFTSDQLGQLSKSNGLVCNSNNLNTVSGETNWKSCITPVASWSNGGVAQYLPEHVGIPVGKMNYYMLEIHYDNPSRTNFEDKSGLRIHYTEKLRKFDGGILVTGVAISNTQFIPPRQKSFRNLGICGQTCTGRKDVFPEEGINLVSVSIQTHSAGRKFILSHVRNGTELDKIVEDKWVSCSFTWTTIMFLHIFFCSWYNHKYQEVRFLPNEINVRANDQLIVDCQYDTQK